MIPPADASPAGDESSALSASGIGDLLADRRFVVDSVVPPLLFVAVNALAGLAWAAGSALGYALTVLVWRALRRDRVLYAVTGLGGAVVGVGLALLSGRAATYFVPGIIANAAVAVGCVVSVLARRPLIAYSSRLLYRWPWAWYLDDRVRPAYSEITWLWAVFYVAKAGVQAWLVARDATALLAIVRIATGLPALAALLVVTYGYVKWRLAALGAPPVERFTPS